MNKSRESSPIFLETDDLTEEERSKAKQTKKGASKDKTKMDSKCLDEIEEPTHTLKFNLHFDRGIRNVKEEPDQQDREKFTLKRLFDAVSSGDVSKLQGLHEYLRKNMKRLTDSQYKSNGKTALLKALLNLKDGENDTIEHLLEIAEKTGDLKNFVNSAYTDSYYKGELPLSLAACTNQPDIVDFLMVNPYQAVDVKKTDSHGNTVLHALVSIADNSPENTEFVTAMYDHILIKSDQLHPKIKLEEIENKERLTPLKLAAKTGKMGLLKHIVQRELKGCKHLSRKITEWAYGPVCSSLYDLASLDTYEKNSALEIIVYGSEIPNRLEMLNIEPFNKLIEEKWERFAKRMFLFNFIVYVIYLFIFTAVAYHHQEGKDYSNNQSSKPPYPYKKDGNGNLLLTGHIVTTIGAIYFFIKGAVLFLACVLLYHLGQDQYLACLVLCLAMSWVNLLYFSRGSKRMGIYNVMIQKMVLGEIRRFLVVYMVFLIGFSAALVTLLDEGSAREHTDSDSPCRKPSFKSIYFTTLELFKFTIGMGDLEFTDQYQYKEVFYVLLIVYIVMTYILMLNMLIALMNQRVEEMSEESTDIWKLQRAITTLDMEWILPHCLKTRLRSGEEKELDGEQEPDRRWCLSVEEVNWNQWNRNLGVVTEDPGKCMSVPSSAKPQKESSRRGLLQTFSKRWTQRPQHRDVQELSPLAEASSSV
ncbi:transient receptor potential cation channel subfamily V member 1-like protein [Labeo rohita]|uniref:Transient receptor potential cation channel subfamily V member 1-like protein n=1 Tax=Labeo rohita TaxID=84645 RepID=A0A498NQA0_LABRO|nr:transient receptor potential cation channel subfamily V member 1-like protein [Labeo rohita]RXN34145.1 transient receptor potential cation channel subfamily V member 1-like protein [Labeo rohita]